MNQFGSGKNQKAAPKKKTEFAKTEKAARPGFLGGITGHVANAVFTTVGAFSGFKALGPAGLAGGALAGQAAGETAKHYASSFFGSRSSGGSASFSSIGELKTAIANQAKSALDAGDTTVNGVKTRLESALSTIISATDGSSHSSVDEMRFAVENAISLCDTNVLTASRSAQARVAAWAGGL